MPNGTEGRTYIHHPHHRNRHPEKSQWTISQQAERTAFNIAAQQQWLTGDRGWGLHDLPAGVIKYLGLSKDRDSNLFIAVFVRNGGKDEWHGYPGDHRRSADRPSSAVLKTWLQCRYFTRRKISKIERGMPCSL